MNRVVPAVALLAGLLICPLKASAAEPYFGLWSSESRGGKVQVISIDPVGLAWQMGLRQNDILVSISSGTGKTDWKMAIRTNADVKKALQRIGKKDGAPFHIVVTRAESTGSQSWSRDDGKAGSKAKIRGGGGNLPGTITKSGDAPRKTLTLQGKIRESNKRPGSYYAQRTTPAIDKTGGPPKVADKPK